MPLRHPAPLISAPVTWMRTALLCAALAACGGGGGGDSASSPASSPVAKSTAKAQAAPVTPAQAARFLGQATFGATPAAIDRVVQIGYEAWLDEQLAVPQSLHQASVAKAGDPISPKFFGFYPIQSSFWRQAATGPDALRQRIMFALSQIFVVSIADMAVIEHPRGVASFMDMLARDGLGNYRTLLEGVALHPMMGIYLSHLANQKEDPASGRVPDENFAREVMQLFSIGVDRLRPDGTVERDGAGRPVESYSNEDVMGLAKVFTGWSWYSDNTSDDYFFAVQPIPLFFSPWADPDRDIRPMKLYPQHHSAGEKRFLGKTVAAGTDGAESLRTALDTLADHPNTGPFIGKQLIQRLVTSNPSASYVQRVAAAFANNGSGSRGDMRAVVKAVLLDPEARSDPAQLGAAAGKVREPILRITAWMRAFDVRSGSGDWRYFFSADPITSIGQSPMQAPSVFNYFRPGYVPPRSAISAAGLVAPEMQIVSETTVASYLNVAEGSMNYWGTGLFFDMNTQYAAEVPLAANPDALIDRVSLLLTGGTLSPESRALIRQAVAEVPTWTYLGPENRVRLAVMMTMSSPDFIVQK